MSTTRTSDCRKFSPNIFNKSKCSHCFRQREEHSAAALECNRASRKVSKCGYLFVAPDWDFSNPLYRTKRWQRRWFVLYDDGELTYSVDEHPETVPQACIDMTKVLEVATAEDVTGHTNSIAITAPDRVTFVKGTCSEESKWWLNILSAFPKSKGRHKRNATFPGGQATTILQTNPDMSTTATTRNRHNSYHKDALTSAQSPGVLIGSAGKNDKRDWHGDVVTVALNDVDDDDVDVADDDDDDEDDEDDGVETGEDDDEDEEERVGLVEKEKTSGERTTKGSTGIIGARNDNNRNAGGENSNNKVTSSCMLIEDIRRDEKTIKDIANTITNLSQQQKSRWSTTAVNNVLNSHLHRTTNHSSDDKKSRDETDFHRPPMATVQQLQQKSQKPSVVSLRPKSLPLASNSTPAIVSAIVKKIPPVLVSSSANSNCSTAGDSVNSNNKNNSSNKCKSSPRLQLQLKHLQQKHQSNQQRQQTKNFQQAHERGDPDGGCNLDDLSANYLANTVELRVNPPPAEESLDSKKGWLMKQDNRTGEWTKHWFTLSGAGLFYYRDPVSEERGVLDGVLDVNSLTNVADVNANKNYAFQLTTWDKRRLTLASIRPDTRNSWITVLRNAAGLQSPTNKPSNNKTSNVTLEPKTASNAELIIKDNTSDDIKSEIEKDFIKAQRNHDLILQTYQESNNNNEIKKISDASPPVIITAATTSTPKTSAISPITPPTPKTAHFSSDEEYRTASEGGRRDSIDWGSPLSPSPPIPLSVLRAKDRMRARTTNCPRLHKRSRSSPPSSRRSTVDSVGSDDLPIIHPVLEELNIDKELQFRLSVAEKDRDLLRNESKAREARMSELLTTLERTEQELTVRVQEMEEVRDNLTTQLEDAKRNAEEIVDRLTDELQESNKKIKNLEDRLARGIDENEALYKRLRELESCSPSSFSNLNRSKFKRMDSLRDLTQMSDIDPYCLERNSLAEEYTELRSRFEKAVSEIKAMKRELKESQNQFDSLEISYASLKQDLERKEIEDRAQLQMMAARIQDLTLKYTSSERQVRTLKQKLAKSERRRSLSLKGKEQLTISKELELKVCEMEAKIDELEKSANEIQTVNPIYTEGKKPNSKKSSRRRSLESSASADSLQFMVRVNDLEKRFEHVSGAGSVSSSSTPTPSCGTPSVDSSARNSIVGTPKISEHLIERLRCLEGVLIASKDRLEQSLQQLQNLRSTRTRRSVSPITDRKDSYRYLERCLGEVVKLIRESCETCVISGTYNAPSIMLLPDSSPVKVALTQLEAQLRNKLADLLKQRRVMRERNELTKRKDLELLAERIAYESICFGKLRDSVARAENPELFGERQTRAEVAETSHLMAMLKAKLSGKCALKPSGTLDIMAGVLARRLVLSTHRKEHSDAKNTMEPVDQNILDDLLRQQNDLNVIAKRYKNNAMENLATGLAAETLSYISSNDLVQGAIQEAWRQAQETVNAELVQSEIAHIMMRNAERFENSITPSFGYTLTAKERLSFEKFADAVQDALRKEMELAVTQLTHCYGEAMQKMKCSQWRLHLQQERKASEGRQLLTEFADIIAHKALVDARIAILRGEYVSNTMQCESFQDSTAKIGITALQRYENLFEELSKDLQINNPDDILAEADFEFMYKQHTVDFLNDRQVLSDISTFLGQLEDSLIALQCEAASTTSISRSAISIESLQDVCHKCCDLRQRADQLLQDVHRKLNTPCQHCLQVREKLRGMQQHHESELVRLQQTHTKDMNVLLQQLENHRIALKSIEAEKNAINEDLHKSEELMEDRERELAATNKELKTRSAELKSRQSSQYELLQRMDDQTKKLLSYQEKNDALAMKCARQDEEYAMLLQERDCIQSQLNKEKERSRRLEKRLEMLEVEHSKQLECLQEAYRDQLLSHCADLPNVTDEESFRQRYQTEIEQLRTLCEKGLSAMESSHRRIITDLEERHKQEIDRLIIEKDTALAEETEATLAALDAMRKAHQSEVQREVARFKQEFLKQFQRGESTLDTTKANEEELEELRQEILSFSEKYSIKCVENAALEEKMRAANHKLKHIQQMQQLELRNKQFRAHLASEDPMDANFVQGLTAYKDEATGQDSEQNTHAHVKFTDDVAMANIMQSSQQTAPSNDAPHTTESLFVIPTSCMLRSHAQPNDIAAATPIPNISNYRDATNDDADDNAVNCRSSYEPCYKQTNLYSFPNRMLFEGGGPQKPQFRRTLGVGFIYQILPTGAIRLTELYDDLAIGTGLKSSTFGKTLKSKTKTTTTATISTAKPNTSSISAASSPASSPKIAIKKQKIEQEDQLQQPQQQFLKVATTAKTFVNSNTEAKEQKLQHLQHNHTYNNHYQKYLQQRQQQLHKSNDLSTTKPVEQQPKNFSSNNYRININNLNHKLNPSEQIHNKLKLVNLNLNNINNNNVYSSSSSSSSDATSPNKTKLGMETNRTIAERSAAINLNSFTDIIKKTAAAVATSVDVGDELQGPSACSSSKSRSDIITLGTKSTATTNSTATTTTTITSTYSNPICSPPPLNGRDVEQSSQKTTSSNSVTTAAKSATQLRRVELET